MIDSGLQIFRPQAATRAPQAHGLMRACRLCAMDCGVDRTNGPAGFCRSDATARVFRERIEWAGESALVPNFVVNLSGCNMTCDFCITGSSSQNGNAGEPLDLAALARRIETMAGTIRSFTIEGGEPTIHLPAALEIASIVPRDLPLVWKTNAFAALHALALLDGVVDYMLADYKFGNDDCARRLAGIPHYTRAVYENLFWGRANTKLIVRHLLMPGHLDCCFRPVARWMAENVPDAPLTLLEGFLPVFRSARHRELNRMNASEEMEEARLEVRELGLTLSPWSVETGPAEGMEHHDEIWIDAKGQVCVGFASAELAACLQRLAPEITMRK